MIDLNRFHADTASPRTPGEVWGDLNLSQSNLQLHFNHTITRRKDSIQEGEGEETLRGRLKGQEFT